VLQSVEKPERDEWGSGVEAMQMALTLEKNVNQVLLDLHKLATQHDDNHLTDFLEGNFLDEQVESIKQLGGFVTQLKRLGPGLGEHMFDKELGEEK
jgi:ferritin heavy chain